MQPLDARHRETVRLLAALLFHRQIELVDLRLAGRGGDLRQGRIGRQALAQSERQRLRKGVAPQQHRTIAARSGARRIDGVAGMLGLPVHEVALASVSLGKAGLAQPLVVIDEAGGVVAIDRPVDQAAGRIDGSTRCADGRHHHGKRRHSDAAAPTESHRPFDHAVGGPRETDAHGE